MKLQTEQKRLIKEALVALGVVACVVGLYAGVSSWASKNTGGLAQLESQANQQSGEISGLRSKIENAGASQKKYATIVEKRGNEDFIIDNATVRDRLLEMIQEHRLVIDGKLEYSAEKLLEDPRLSSAVNPFAVRKDARIKFTAISDLHAYAFLDSLQRRLPGIVQYTKFTLKRTGDLSPDVLSQLSLGRTVNLVEAEVQFDWYGMKPVSENKEEAK